MPTDEITIRGAREHNLKNVTLSIPRDRLVVFTGLSGSGKSSLAFDTIYAEGQRRYVESLSAYARQFLGQMEKPDVDIIEGLSPAISIDQKGTSKNPRSTVGTVTEVYDYLRLLYARVGHPHCPVCGREVQRQTVEQMADHVEKLPKGTRIMVLGPVVKGRKGEYRSLIEDIRKSGFVRVRVDGSLYEIGEPIPMDKNKKHDVQVVVDRIVVGPEQRTRLVDSVETAVRIGGGTVIIAPVDVGEEIQMSQDYACQDDGPQIPESLAVTVGGRNIAEVSELSISAAIDFFDSLELTEPEKLIATQILQEIRERLQLLVDVRLDYLTIARPANTLSRGESQRMRLATQIGSKMSGVLYVIDEPSIGLHQRDNRRLIDALLRLRDLGNTVIVVEHEEETIRAADYMVDLGPAAGEHGGEIVAAGPVEEVLRDPSSITAAFLRGDRTIPVPPQRRKGNGKKLVVRGATANNLKNIDASFPLSTFVAVSGVSGSGKSSLLTEILNRNRDDVIDIDQSPIGRTPRSNPATYTGMFDHIRELFASLPAARMRGYRADRFSFNVKGGRCEACKGDGIIQIDMQFMPDVFVRCEVCHGTRYAREMQEVKFRGHSISDVLAMTVDQALDVFQNVPSIKARLRTLHDVGLGYIRLGQPSTQLSGGEAQRVRLAAELSRRDTGRTLYLLDEPTTGLHYADVEKLLAVLHRLVDRGNTVVVIEHNLDVLKTADWLIDLGPEGGDKGGYVIAAGTPEQVAAVPGSVTGQYLSEALSRSPRPLVAAA